MSSRCTVRLGSVLAMEPEALGWLTRARSLLVLLCGEETGRGSWHNLAHDLRGECCVELDLLVVFARALGVLRGVWLIEIKRDHLLLLIVESICFLQFICQELGFDVLVICCKICGIFLSRLIVLLLSAECVDLLLKVVILARDALNNFVVKRLYR